MPSSDPQELFESFLKFQKEKEHALKEKDSLEELLKTHTKAKNSLIPLEAYNPNGTINYPKLLAKLSNPSVLLAIIVAATNLYIEYQNLKIEVKEQKTQIVSLQKENEETSKNLRHLLDRTRNQFTLVERNHNDLKIAISNVQTEVQVRHGASSESRVRDVTRMPAASRRTKKLSPREQIKLLDREANSALERVEQRKSAPAPLAGLDF